MQSYVLALTVARSSEDTEVVRSKDIKAAIAEFERRLNLPGLTQAVTTSKKQEICQNSEWLKVTRSFFRFTFGFSNE